ncbi:polysaccharide biosynthesis protein [Prochlorococcus sp. MIT 1011]|uniref:polysaccharide biosynthesis protein n=1 Tax=Prochlorococcus sp. MIT 1011 TaxID=3082520 RepID=UPI0039B3DBA0
MNLYIKRYLNKIVRLNPRTRRLILLLLDVLLLPISTYITLLFLTKNDLYPIYKEYLLISIPAIFIGIPLFLLNGHYKGLTRHVGSKSIYKIALSNAILSISILIINLAIASPQIPNRVYFLFWIISTGILGSTRFIIRDLIIGINNNNQIKTRVAIYGANENGAQVEASLKLNKSFKVVMFLDNDPLLNGRSINGIDIHSIFSLDEFKKYIDIVLIPSNDLLNQETKESIGEILNKGISVMQVPQFMRKNGFGFSINNLLPIEINDLLGRESILPKTELLLMSIKNSVVLVTGGGGSIGSELCKQIIKLNPLKLIVFDNSEPSLYSISTELKEIAKKELCIHSVLGNVCDEKLVKSTLNEHKVNLIFHAAAYKHVPLVEENPFQGILNNIISTKSICSAAGQSNVSKVMLISSDKAVRPTNVMGASKRISELIFQDYANKQNSIQREKNQSKICFSMVRFGNVLGSSGSVVPLFKKQILYGGPITLTHPEIYRYFMTIKEASDLVLQSSAIAEGGEVFLLDMGEPVKIIDLAKQMIKLSGLTIKTDDNPSGDIVFNFIGLRPGEKLREELLIDSNAIETKHPLIYKANEVSLASEVLWRNLEELLDAAHKRNKEDLFNSISKIVPEWKHNF